jgi:hypothetical protein
MRSATRGTNRRYSGQAGVLLLGTLKGILVAVLVSLVALVIRASRHPLPPSPQVWVKRRARTGTVGGWMWSSRVSTTARRRSRSFTGIRGAGKTERQMRLARLDSVGSDMSWRKPR